MVKINFNNPNDENPLNKMGQNSAKQSSSNEQKSLIFWDDTKRTNIAPNVNIFNKTVKAAKESDPVAQSLFEYVDQNKDNNIDEGELKGLFKELLKIALSDGRNTLSENDLINLANQLSLNKASVESLKKYIGCAFQNQEQRANGRVVDTEFLIKTKVKDETSPVPLFTDPENGVFLGFSSTYYKYKYNGEDRNLFILKYYKFDSNGQKQQISEDTLIEELKPYGINKKIFETHVKDNLKYDINSNIIDITPLTPSGTKTAQGQDAKTNVVNAATNNNAKTDGTNNVQNKKNVSTTESKGQPKANGTKTVKEPLMVQGDGTGVVDGKGVDNVSTIGGDVRLHNNDNGNYLTFIEIPEFCKTPQEAARYYAGKYIQVMYDEVISYLETHYNQLGALDFEQWGEWVAQGLNNIPSPLSLLSNLTNSNDDEFSVNNAIKGKHAFHDIKSMIKDLKKARENALNTLTSECMVKNEDSFESAFKKYTGRDYNHYTAYNLMKKEAYRYLSSLPLDDDNKEQIYNTFIHLTGGDLQGANKPNQEDFISDLHRYKESTNALQNEITNIRKNLYGEELLKQAKEHLDFWLRKAAVAVGDIAIMLYATETGAGLLAKAGEKVLGKAMVNIAEKALLRYAYGAVQSATTFVVWDSIHYTVNSLTAEGREFNWDEYFKTIAHSAAFGAFAGVTGQALEAVIPSKSVKEIQKLFKNGEVRTAEDVLKIAPKGAYPSLATASAAEIKAMAANVAKDTPINLAKFGIEVGAFTGFETTWNVIGDILSGEDKYKNMDLEQIMLSLEEEFGHQLKNLASIKGVAQLLKFRMGARIGASPKEMISEMNGLLGDIKIRQVKKGKKTQYEISLNGKKQILNDERSVMAFCLNCVQQKIITNIHNTNNEAERTGTATVSAKSTLPSQMRETLQSLREEHGTDAVILKRIKNEKGKYKGYKVIIKTEEGVKECVYDSGGKLIKESEKHLESTSEIEITEVAEKNPILTKLETANDRESFVAIRDEIKKMPNGAEKTRVMQEYTKKYNEWTQNSARLDIRMQAQEQSPKTVQEFVDKLKEMKNPDGSPRFSAEKIDDVAENCKKYPKDAEILIRMKNADGSPRFSIDEIVEEAIMFGVYGKSTLGEHPKAADALAKMKNSDGSPRFNAREIVQLTETYENHPDAVKKLAQMEDSEGSPRFDGIDIPGLAEAYENHRETVKKLAEMKKSDGRYRFDNYQIAKLAEVYEKYPEAVKKIIEMKNPDGRYRFDTYQIAELAEVYEKYPESVKKIIEMKNPDGTPRFNAGEIAQLIETYENHREAVDKLAEMKKSDGSPRFTTEEITKLAEACQNYSKAVKELAEMNKPDGSPRFTTEEITELAETCENHSKAVKELAEIKDSKGNPRFRAKEICILAQGAYLNYPSTVKEMAQMENPDGNPKFTGGEIACLCIVYRRYPEAVKTLVEMENNGSPRFSAKEILKLVDAYKNHPELVKKFAEMKNDDGSPRFNGYEIAKLAEAYEKHTTTFEKFAEMKNDDGSPRFNGYEIAKLAEAYEKHTTTFEKLAEMKDFDGRYRFSGFDIANLAKPYEKYPDAVEKLAEMKDSEGRYRFDGLDISFLVEDYENHREAVDKLAEIKKDDGKTPRFKGYDIFNLTEAYETHPEAVRELAGIKKDDGSYRFNGSEIAKLAETYEKYSDDVIALAEMKDSDGSPRFNAGEIVQLTETYENHPEAVKKLAEIKKDDGKTPRFDGKDIADLAEAYENHRETVKKLAEMKKSDGSSRFSAFEIATMVKYNKIREKVLNNENCKIEKNPTSDKYFSIVEGKERLNYFINEDGNLELLNKESNTFKRGRRIQEIEYPDGSKKIFYDDFSGGNANATLEEVIDKDGNRVSRTLSKPSKRHPGVIVTLKEIYDKNGNVVEVKKIGTVTHHDAKGDKVKIKREYTSPSGESTHTIVQREKTTYSHFKSAGAQTTRKFWKFDGKQTLTIVDGERYTAEFGKDKITVTRKTSDGKTQTVVLDSNLLDFRLLDLYKQLPGDYLFRLQESGIRVELGYEANNACYASYNNTIYLSEELKNDPFTFAHEFGHAMDHVKLNSLRNDPKLRKIFEKEYDQFRKEHISAEDDIISYFTDSNSIYKNAGLAEIIAEVNAISSGLIHNDNFILQRAKILQENFPETSAYIVNKFKTMDKQAASQRAVVTATKLSNMTDAAPKAEKTTDKNNVKPEATKPAAAPETAKPPVDRSAEPKVAEEQTPQGAKTGAEQTTVTIKLNDGQKVKVTDKEKVSLIANEDLASSSVEGSNNTGASKIYSSIKNVYSKIKFHFSKESQLLNSSDILTHKILLSKITDEYGKPKFTKTDINKILNSLPQDVKITGEDLYALMTLPAITEDLAISILSKIDSPEKLKVLNALTNTPVPHRAQLILSGFKNISENELNPFEIENIFDNLKDCKVSDLGKLYQSAVWYRLHERVKGDAPLSSFLTSMSYNIKTEAQKEAFLLILGKTNPNDVDLKIDYCDLWHSIIPKITNAKDLQILKDSFKDVDNFEHATWIFEFIQQHSDKEKQYFIDILSEVRKNYTKPSSTDVYSVLYILANKRSNSNVNDQLLFNMIKNKVTLSDIKNLVQLKNTDPSHLIYERLNNGKFDYDLGALAEIKYDNDYQKQAFSLLLDSNSGKRFEALAIQEIIKNIKDQKSLDLLKELLQNKNNGAQKIIESLEESQRPQKVQLLKGQALNEKSSKNATAESSEPEKFNSNLIKEYLILNVKRNPEYKDHLIKLYNASPKRFKKMLDSGLFDLIKEGKIDASILKNLDDNTFLSNRTLNDIRKIRNGEPLIKTLSSQADLANISKHVANGDVCELNGKLYVNDNGSAIEIKLSKEKFEELFPPLTRISFEQGQLGDCWLVSALDNLMDLPKGRVALYKLFEQQGDDILIKFPNGANPIKFEGGKVLDAKGKQIQGFSNEIPVGIRMIEQAYAVHRYKKYDNDAATTDILAHAADVPSLMSELAGGFTGHAINEILGEIVSSNEGGTNLKNRKIMADRIKRYANDGNVLIYFGTRRAPGGDTNIIAKKYDLAAQHAYTIKGYDKNSGMVYITNPWHTSVITEVPLYELMKYIQHVNIAQIAN